MGRGFPSVRPEMIQSHRQTLQAVHYVNIMNKDDMQNILDEIRGENDELKKKNEILLTKLKSVLGEDTDKEIKEMFKNVYTDQSMVIEGGNYLDKRALDESVENRNMNSYKENSDIYDMYKISSNDTENK